MKNNTQDWVKDIQVIRSEAITEIQKQIDSGYVDEAEGDELLKKAALSVLADKMEGDMGESQALEMVKERYITEDGQIVNPGVSKAEWDRIFIRSGLDPKGIIEYNSN